MGVSRTDGDVTHVTSPSVPAYNCRRTIFFAFVMPYPAGTKQRSIASCIGMSDPSLRLRPSRRVTKSKPYRRSSQLCFGDRTNAASARLACRRCALAIGLGDTGNVLQFAPLHHPRGWIIVELHIVGVRDRAED